MKNELYPFNKALNVSEILIQSAISNQTLIVHFIKQLSHLKSRDKGHTDPPLAKSQLLNGWLGPKVCFENCMHTQPLNGLIT